MTSAEQAIAASTNAISFVTRLAARDQADRQELNRQVTEVLAERDRAVTALAYRQAADDIDAQFPFGVDRTTPADAAHYLRRRAQQIEETGQEERCVGCGDPINDGKAHGHGNGYGGCV